MHHKKQEEIIMSTSFIIHKASDVITENASTREMSGDNAFLFHKSLSHYQPTPCLQLKALAEKSGVGEIYVKDESKRFGLNAFKGLGAVYAIHQVLKKNPDITTFCTATDGNHGKAVAWGASLFGKKSVVYVPEDTTTHRMKAIEAEGAIVEKVNGDYDFACAHAEKNSIRNKWQLVQDMAWEGYEEIPSWIMAGYMTLFREMENDIHILPEPLPDIVFMQAGVGSFAASGVYYYLKRYGKKRPAIVVVEPLQADAIFSSLKEGKLTTSKGNARTIMAGLNCGTPSTTAWDIIKNGIDVSLKVPDSYAAQAMRLLYYPGGDDPRIISGESGAAGLVGFLAIMHEKKLEPVKDFLKLNASTRILFINTEGDTDKDVFQKIISARN